MKKKWVPLIEDSWGPFRFLRDRFKTKGNWPFHWGDTYVHIPEQNRVTHIGNYCQAGSISSCCEPDMESIIWQHQSRGQAV